MGVLHGPSFSRGRAAGGGRRPARGCRSRASSSAAGTPPARVHERPAARRRRAEPGRGRLPFGQQHGQRQAGRGEEPLRPRGVVVAVHVQVPAVPGVAGQPGRVSVRGEQGVDPVRGPRHVDRRRTPRAARARPGAGPPGRPRRSRRVRAPRAPAAPRSARPVRPTARPRCRAASSRLPGRGISTSITSAARWAAPGGCRAGVGAEGTLLVTVHRHSVTYKYGKPLPGSLGVGAYLGGAAAARAGDEMSGPALLLLGFAATGRPSAGSELLAGLTIAAAAGGPVFGALLDRSPAAGPAAGRHPGRLRDRPRRARGRGRPTAVRGRGAGRAGRRAVQPGGGGRLDRAATAPGGRGRAGPRLRARRDDLQRGQPGRAGARGAGGGVVSAPGPRC